MSNYSFSEEGSEATADEDLLRDLDNLREVLEEDDLEGSREEEGTGLGSLAERPLEGLKLCLHKNHENQVLLKWMLKKIDKALEANHVKRDDPVYPHSQKRHRLTFWRFYNGSYFKNHRGRSAPSSEDARAPARGPRNFYLTDNVWLSHREDAKLLEGLKMLAIEKRSYPLQEKLLDAKTNEEKKAIRKQIRALKDLGDEELFTDLEMSNNDWYSISYVQFSEHKTMGDCRLRWENHLSPSFYRGPWGKEEEKKLVKVANQHHCIDWKTIAQEIGTNRTPFAYLKHYQELFRKSSIQKHQWTREMDKLLKEAVGKYGEKNWRAVADEVGHGVSHSQCLHRWFNSTNPSIKKGRWSEQEDELLKEAIKMHGTKWSMVACLIPSRTATQCRERWVNVLDSSLNRGKWEPEEDQRLINICRRYEGGSIPWARVAQELGARTDAMCSTRWRNLSSTPEVVQQYASRVAEKVLTKKSNLSPKDIEQDMLPEACLQQVQEYKDRLINFKSKRRKSSICLGPTMILKARGIHMFPEDSSSSSPRTSRSAVSSLASTSRSAATSGRSRRAASSNRRGTATTSSGTGQTRAKNRRKRKIDATPAPSGGGAESAQNGESVESTQTGGARESEEGEPEPEPEPEQQPPPRKKRAYRRRARVQNAGHGNISISGQGSASIAVHSTTTTPPTVVGGGAGHHDDMMQLTEQFAQQHYRNIVSQVAPTPPPPPLQQMTGYTPTSLSFYGIPVFMETRDAVSSTAPPVQLTSTSAFQASLPPISEVMGLPPMSKTSSSSLSMTSSQSPAMSTMPRFAGLRMPHSYNPLTMLSSQTHSLATQPLPGFSSFPHAPALTRSSQSVAISPSSIAPTVSAQSQIHLASLSRTQISQPSLTTQISPTASIVSSPSLAVAEASQSSRSTGQTLSVSTRSQAPSDQVVFPKGPSYITVVRHPDLRTISYPSRPLNTAPSSSFSYSGHSHTNTAPSPYIQPHASLLAPEFRQSDLFSAGTATESTSVCTTTSSTSTTTSGSPRRNRDSNFGVAMARRSTRGIGALATGSVSGFSRTFGDNPYPSFGISIPARVPSTSISFTSVTDSTSSVPGRSSAHSPLNPNHPVGAAVSALLSLSDRTNSRSPSQFTTASPLPRMSYLPLRSSRQLAGSLTVATSLSETTSNSVSYPLATTTTPTSAARAGNGLTYTSPSTTPSLGAPAISNTASSNVTTTSTSVSCHLATTTTPTSSPGGGSSTSSTTRSPGAPAIIAAAATTNSQTSNGAGSGGIISSGTAAERSTAVVTESRTRPQEDMDCVHVMTVPDAIHYSENLLEESETMRLTQEQAVAVQKVDGPSLIGNDDDDAIVGTATATGITSPSGETRRESAVESLGDGQEADSIASPSPRKQPRMAAAAKKTGRRTTTRRRTTNSKRKS